MGFTDMLSSGRGPGVIGTLLGLGVLGGFAVLFFLVFDERFQGGEMRLEVALRQQRQTMERLQEDLLRGEERLREVEARRQEIRRIEKLKAKAELMHVTVTEGEARLAEAKEQLAQQDQAFEDYKNRYRRSEWKKAEGEAYETLKTLSGKEYRGVKIRSVDPIGVMILHEAGSRRIDSDDCPLDWQERFQFDDGIKEEAKGRELEGSKALASTMTLQEMQNRLRREEKAFDDYRQQVIQAQQEIQRQEIEGTKLRSQLDDAQGRLSRDQSIRGVGISRRPQIEAEISSLKRRIENQRLRVLNLRKLVQGAEIETKVRQERLERLRKEIADKAAEQ